MHRTLFASALGLLALTLSANAHIRVLPLESHQGMRQTYTVKVPTEGNVATTSVELEIPEGVSVTSVMGQAEAKKAGTRTVSITWKVQIPPGQSMDLVFEATNPANGQEVIWKAHQHFADGSSRHWVDAPRTPSPASVTKLSAGAH